MSQSQRSPKDLGAFGVLQFICLSNAKESRNEYPSCAEHPLDSDKNDVPYSLRFPSGDSLPWSWIVSGVES